MAAKPTPSGSHATFLLGGYAVLVLGFLAVVLYPWISGTKMAQADIQNYQGQIESRQAGSRQLEEIKRQVTLISAETHDYERLVPHDDDLGAFLEQVTKAFNATGMKDLAKSNVSKTPLGRSQKLSMELQGRGTYSQVHDFLASVEKLPRLSSVGRLTIDAETDMSGYVEFHLILHIYSAKPATGS